MALDSCLTKPRGQGRSPSATSHARASSRGTSATSTSSGDTPSHSHALDRAGACHSPLKALLPIPPPPPVPSASAAALESASPVPAPHALRRSMSQQGSKGQQGSLGSGPPSQTASGAEAESSGRGGAAGTPRSDAASLERNPSSVTATSTPPPPLAGAASTSTPATAGSASGTPAPTPSAGVRGKGPGSELKSSLVANSGSSKGPSGGASDGFKVPSTWSQAGDTPPSSRMPPSASTSGRATARPLQQQHMPRVHQQQQQQVQQVQGRQPQQGSSRQAGGVPAQREALLKQIQELTGILTEVQTGTGKMQALASAAAAVSGSPRASQQPQEPFAGAAPPSHQGGTAAPGTGGGAAGGSGRESEQQSFDLLCTLLPLLATASGTPGALQGTGAQVGAGANAGGSLSQEGRQDQVPSAANQSPSGSSQAQPQPQPRSQGAGPAPSALEALINAIAAAASAVPQAAQARKVQPQGGPNRGFAAPAQMSAEGAGWGAMRPSGPPTTSLALPSAPSFGAGSAPPMSSPPIPSLPSFTFQPGSQVAPSPQQSQGSGPHSSLPHPAANLPSPRQPGVPPPRGGVPQPSAAGRSDQAQVLAGRRPQGGASASAEPQESGGAGGGTASFSSASFDVLKRELERLLAEQHVKAEAHQPGERQHMQQGQGHVHPGMGWQGPPAAQGVGPGAGGPMAAPQRQQPSGEMQQDLQRLHDQLQQHLRLQQHQQQQQQQQQQQGVIQHRRAPHPQGAWPAGGHAGSVLSSSEEEEASSQVQPPTPGSSACSPSALAHSTFSRVPSRQHGVAHHQGRQQKYQPPEHHPYHHQQQQQEQRQQFQEQQGMQMMQQPQRYPYQQQQGGLVKPSAMRLPSVQQAQGPNQQQQGSALADSHPQGGSANREAAAVQAGSAPLGSRSAGGSWAPWAAAFRASGREPPSLAPAALQGLGEGGPSGGGGDGASKSCLSSPLGSSSADFEGSLTQMSTPSDVKPVVHHGGRPGAGGGEGAEAPQGARLNPPYSQRSLPPPGALHHPLQQQMGGPGGAALVSQSSPVHPLSPLAASLAASAPISPTTPSTRTPGVLDDGYTWRKYGQKPAKGAHFPRSYYRCAVWDCPARKTVELAEDGDSTEIVYKEEHNHPQSVRTGPRFAGAAGPGAGRPGRQGADRVMMTEDMVGALEQELHGGGGPGAGGMRAPGASGERAWELEVLGAGGGDSAGKAHPAPKLQRGQWSGEGGDGGVGAGAVVIKRPRSPLLVGEPLAGVEGAARGPDGRSPWDIPLHEEDPTVLQGGEGGKPGGAPASPGRKRKLTQREGAEAGVDAEGGEGAGAAMGRERGAGGSPKPGANQGSSSCVTCLPVKTTVRVEAARDELDDGFKWRKYGEKAIKHSAYKRNYYRCSKDGCSVKRVIERLQEDPKLLQITYEGEHNHARPIVARVVHSQGHIRVHGMIPGGPASAGGVPGVTPPLSPTSQGMGGPAGALVPGSLGANPLSLPPVAPLVTPEVAAAATAGRPPASAAASGPGTAPLSGRGSGAPAAGPPTARNSAPPARAGAAAASAAGGRGASTGPGGRGASSGAGAVAAAPGRGGAAAHGGPMASAPVGAGLGASGHSGAAHGAPIPNSASLDIGDVEVSFLKEIEQKMDEYLPPLA